MANRSQELLLAVDGRIRTISMKMILCILSKLYTIYTTFRKLSGPQSLVKSKNVKSFLFVPLDQMAPIPYHHSNRPIRSTLIIQYTGT
jgi:hypothetical protein